MSQLHRPTLRLLSLNVNGLRSADKRRSLFSLLRRDRWDIVLLQETHHTHETDGQAWAEELTCLSSCQWKQTYQTNKANLGG